MAHPIERAIIAQLTPGAGGARFALRPGAATQLAPRLARALAGPDAEAAVETTLRLAAAMDGKLASPAVAAELRALLAASPRAIATIRERRARQRRTQPVDALRRFARREGRAAALRAPLHDGHVPTGAVPLRALVELGQARLDRAEVAARGQAGRPIVLTQPTRGARADAAPQTNPETR